MAPVPKRSLEVATLSPLSSPLDEPNVSPPKVTVYRPEASAPFVDSVNVVTCPACAMVTEEKPVAVNGVKTLHADVVCEKKAVPVVVIVTVTTFAVHVLAGNVVAVVKVSTGLTPDVPLTRETQGIVIPTRETCPITVGIASFATQDATSMVVDMRMPFVEL